MYKRIVLSLLIAVIIAFDSIAACPANAAVPDVNAMSYVVMDASDGRVLYSKNKDDKIYPASTTKIVTAMCVLDSVSLDKKIKFTKQMRKLTHTSDIAHIDMPVGTVYTVREYLYMMLMASDASSAVALAIGTAGSVPAFAKKMNAKVKALGLTHTKFDNPVGLDKGNKYYKIHSTAYDFAVLSRKAMTYKTIRKIAATKQYTVAKCKKKPAIKINNTNMFYSSYDYDKTKYSVIGLKTGSTNAAKYTMVVVGRDKSGREVICSYFGATTNVGRYEGIRKLLDYTYKMAGKGKIKLHKDFWDARYNKNSALIRKYADSGVISMSSNGRFYPNKAVTGSKFSSYLSKIKGVDITFANDTVSVKEFVDAYNSYYSTECTIEECVSAGILPKEAASDSGALITNADAVFIASKVKGLSTEIASKDAAEKN